MGDVQARLKAASSFILQSPPGEVNDVFNDVRALVGDDEALEAGILPALEQYNVEQFIVADLPDKTQLLVCEAGHAQDDVSSSGNTTSRFIEPNSGTSWSFDHLRLTGSDPVPVHIDTACEVIRKELEEAARRYGQEFFAEGVSKVFTTYQTRLVKPKQAHQTQAPIQEEGEKDVVKEDQEMTQEEPAAHEETEIVVQTAQRSSEEVPPLAEEQATAPAETQEDSEMTSAPTPAVDQGEDIIEDVQADTVTAAAEAPAAVEPEVKAEETKEEEVEEVHEPLQKKFSLYFVGNKYNPSNYWTGRWRSSYVLDLSSSPASLTGQIQLNVHFFEQGNVQLSTSHQPKLELPSSISESSSPAELAKTVLKVIGKAEEEYQLELNETYREMADKTFKSLRRALPITRQKMDWAKVANYKLQRDIGGTAN